MKKRHLRQFFIHCLIIETLRFEIISNSNDRHFISARSFVVSKVRARWIITTTKAASYKRSKRILWNISVRSHETADHCFDFVFLCFSWLFSLLLLSSYCFCAVSIYTWNTLSPRFSTAGWANASFVANQTLSTCEARKLEKIFTNERKVFGVDSFSFLFITIWHITIRGGCVAEISHAHTRRITESKQK